MRRCCRVLLVALVALGVAAPSAGAVPDKKLGGTLGALWERILETPSAENPFGSGGARSTASTWAARLRRLGQSPSTSAR
jgi:hypothetical protein